MSNKTVKTTPVFEGRARKPLDRGRVLGTDGSMWLWRTVPMGAIADAKTLSSALESSQPLAMALNEVSMLTTTRGINRSLAKKNYREVQLLLTNFPRWYQAPETNPIASELNQWFRDMQVDDRRLMLGVRLVPTAGDGTVRGFLESAQQTLFNGGGVLESDYEKDFHQVAAALDRAGLSVPGSQDFMAADGWYNLGDPRPVSYLEHTNHIHYFSTEAAQRRAKDEEDLVNCEHWDDIPDHRVITFATLAEFDIGYTPVSERKAWWASELLQMGARVVSVRFTLEPATITYQELKSQKRRVRADLEEGYQKGKDQARREEREAEIHAIEGEYDKNKKDMPPTVVDMSVIVGFAGAYSDEEVITTSCANFFIMSNRQLQAWHETMICSNVRGNPYLHDVPAQTLAYSGITNLTRVGDEDGAFLGLTRDRQPVYLNAVAASHGDAAPLVLCGAGTGSGKTVLLQFIAYQHGKMGVPTVIIDPKEDSDLRGAFLDVPGFTVRSLDDFITSDGGLDPLTLYRTPIEGVPLASRMLYDVNPWGDERRRKYEAEISNAIRYGVEHGAVVTGQAIALAYKDGQVRREVIEDVFRVAQTFPMFRATFGLNPPREGDVRLLDSKSVTLFMRGSSPLSLPGTSSTEMDAVTRQSVNLLRMLVRGSMTALSGRGGVLHMDEAWVLERAVPDELQELGRLARSMNVLPIMYTQTPTGPLNLKLRGYFSRGLIGHLHDEQEASAALELFSVNRKDTLNRVTAKDSLADDKGLNFNSLKALYKRDPETGKRTLVRGSEFLYGDLKERFAATTIMLPPEFLARATTNPEEVARRMRELEAQSS